MKCSLIVAVRCATFRFAERDFVQIDLYYCLFGANQFLDQLRLKIRFEPLARRIELPAC